MKQIKWSGALKQKNKKIMETKIASDGVKVKLMTTKELAENLGVSYVQASGFVGVLVDKGAIKKVGSRAAAGGRGKPSDVFEFSSVIELVVWEDNQNKSAPESAPVVESAETTVESVAVIS